MIQHAYIHIPFCIRKCHYCSFVSGINIKYKEIYLKALIQQIKTSYKNEFLKTLYIGGGTPSLLDSDDLDKIIECFNLYENAEITLEVNPETVEKEKFEEIKKTKINRISLGVQSFNDNILKLIGRNHTKNDILNSIRIIKQCGFNNISIDLIYGLPNQDINVFKQDIEQALKLDVQHISTYGLKIEPNSHFGKFPPQNTANDEQQADMFTCLCNTLKKNGFEHYEISNFSKHNYESKHNCAYWKNKNYYGFGLNASGYEKNKRYRNTDIFEDYIKTPNLKSEEVELSNQEIMEDEIFLALRLKDGIDIEKINKKFNINFTEKYQKIIEKYSQLQLLENINNHIRLTEQGFLLSNEVMSEFID